MTQEKALDILKTGANVFLTGEPGAGKTYTVNLFRKWCQEEGNEVYVTASTGIAASHLNGTTIHSWSGINTRRLLSREKIEQLKFNEYVFDRVNHADVLIIDEISMLDFAFIDDLDAVCRILRGNVNTSFGGIQVVVVGDFFQLPPVPPRGVREVDFAFESRAWEEANFKVCYLTEQHRQSDATFLSILSHLRQGALPPEERKILEACTYVSEPQLHLYPLRVEVDQLNYQKIVQINEPEHTYKMRESGIPYLVQVLKHSVLSPELLVLKLGAEVMFTRNDTSAWEYVNGSLGVVVGFLNDNYGYESPIVRLRNGKEISPEIAEWTIEEHGVQKASVRQFPLRLAWAITVHKSQGMTLDSASIDLSRCFEYGQGYVAISRIRDLSGLHLSGINDVALKVHPKVVAKDKEFRSTDI